MSSKMLLPPRPEDDAPPCLLPPSNPGNSEEPFSFLMPPSDPGNSEEPFRFLLPPSDPGNSEEPF